MKYVVVMTKKGIVKRFNLDEVRPMGRSAKGVRGISLDDGDEVVAMDVVVGDEAVGVSEDNEDDEDDEDEGGDVDDFDEDFIGTSDDF